MTNPTLPSSPPTIATLDALRALYPAPQPRAVQKQIAALDGHCRRFIALSPFVLLATGDAQQQMDASPRGGAPGFVRVTDDGALLIPDAPGNNRLDSLENIVSTGQVGLLFLIPGVDETLRVNGRAVLSLAADDIVLCTDERRAPRLVIRVAVQAAYLHCAKAFMRSRLWDAQAQVERSVLPTAGQMISDQTGLVVPLETQADMARRYAPDL
jgi:PPOX class probable FMN-dependent enzyme